jgi:2-(1,2-epoxy-1,2-dihydrophenyl)acetyl-CoA isomerase
MAMWDKGAMAEVAVQRAGAVTIVEMRRPPFNHFDDRLLRAVADECERAQSQDGCHAIVLCSEGRHFCAGADFGTDAFEGDRDAAAARIYAEGVRLFRIEVPIVAAVQGAAVGGGLGLACAADFRTGSASTRLHANFAALGFHQGFGLSLTLPRIVGHQRAKEMLLTSRPVPGETALAIGLLDRLAEPGAERAAAVDLATEIAAVSPLAARSIKRTLIGTLPDDIPAVLEHELHEQQQLWHTPDSQARVAAALSRQRPRAR